MLFNDFETAIILFYIIKVFIQVYPNQRHPQLFCLLYNTTIYITARGLEGNNCRHGGLTKPYLMKTEVTLKVRLCFTILTDSQCHYQESEKTLHAAYSTRSHTHSHTHTHTCARLTATKARYLRRGAILRSQLCEDSKSINRRLSAWTSHNNRLVCHWYLRFCWQPLLVLLTLTLLTILLPLLWYCWLLLRALWLLLVCQPLLITELTATASYLQGIILLSCCSHISIPAFTDCFLELRTGFCNRDNFLPSNRGLKRTRKRSSSYIGSYRVTEA